MPEEMIPVGAPCWVDLMTGDVARSREFYTRLFGWTAEDAEEKFGGYFNFRRENKRIAGCMGKMQPEMPDVWGVHLRVEEAKETIDKAVANGGQVVVEPMDVDTLGTMAAVVDPGGAIIGIWQPRDHPGFSAVRVHGAPGWFELHTRDHAKSVDFYRNVFGWTTQSIGDTDEFRYTVFEKDGQQHAGIMDSSSFLPEGVPAHWKVYFAVDDTDVCLEQVQSLGGSVVQPAQDTPYGRLAVAADPNGAQFSLVGPNDAMPATG
ncbi:MAG: VOC family protein [Frankiales bacterium]|nr:VOC family protein [Frankiales bacterium]